MAKAQDVRPIIKLRSTAGTGLHLRDPQEPPQRPRPPRAEEVRPRRPQARRIPRGALNHGQEEQDRAQRAAQGHRRALRREAPRAEEGLVDPNGTDEQREAARLGLQKLPRNASPVRVRNRDAIDGRPRGVLSKFGISRVRFRDMAHRGELPGHHQVQLVSQHDRNGLRRASTSVGALSFRPVLGAHETAVGCHGCAREATRRRNVPKSAEIRVNPRVSARFKAVNRPDGVAHRAAHPIHNSCLYSTRSEEDTQWLTSR